jgi:hypothetical protein
MQKQVMNLLTLLHQHFFRPENRTLPNKAGYIFMHSLILLKEQNIWQLGNQLAMIRNACEEQAYAIILSQKNSTNNYNKTKLSTRDQIMSTDKMMLD